MKRVCIILTAAAWLASASAFADARQHFMAGKDYYTQGRYQKAVDEFVEAYRLDPKPLLLFNIAQAWEKLGELEKAVDYFKQFIQADPNNEDRETLLARISALEERISETGLTIVCEEPDATVYVDNKEVGKTPLSGDVKVSTGTHKIQVSKAGFEDFKMTVVAAAGKAIPVDVSLEPGQAGPAIVAPAEKPEGEGAQGGEGRPDGGEKKIEALDIVPWAIAGVGVVGVGVGWGVLGSMAKNNQPSDPDAEPDKQDDAHKLALVSDIVGIASAVVAAAGATWGIIRVVKKKKGESAEPAASAEVSMAPIFGDGVGGAVAAVRF